MTISSSDIEDQAKAPLATRTAEGSVRERSIRELIEAHKYQQQLTALEAPPYGLRQAMIQFPDTQ